MARRKVVTTEVDDEHDELALPPVVELPADSTEQDAIDELRALGGDEGVTWTVRKIPNKPGERGGYCAKYSSGELSMDAIRETFGGGKYQIRGTDLRGKYIEGGTRTIDIVELPKPLNGAPAPSQDIAAILAAVKPGDNGMAVMMPLLIKMIESSSAQTAAMMTAIAGRKDETKLTDILALINATKPDKGGVELLLEGLKLGQSFSGGGGGDGSNWLDIAGKGLDILKPVVAAQAAAASNPAPALPAPTPVAVPALGAPAPAAPSPAQLAPNTPGVDPMLQQLNWLRAQLNTLVYQAAKNAAGKGGDPELYADIVLDNLPPYITPEALYERISAPDAIAQLAQVDARVNQYVPWFTTFRQSIIDSFAPDDEEGDEPGDTASI